jgi:hypothetical protein
MATDALIPWIRRPELIMRPARENGQHVVKDSNTGNYFNIGEQEAFLLSSLDGRQTVAGVCAAFLERFGEPFSANDLRDFLEVAYAQGFVTNSDSAPVEPVRKGGGVDRKDGRAKGTHDTVASPLSSRKQSLLSWRIRIFDPDRLLTWLAPRLSFCYTKTFAAVSLVCGGCVSYGVDELARAGRFFHSSAALGNLCARVVDVDRRDHIPRNGPRLDLQAVRR